MQEILTKTSNSIFLDVIQHDVLRTVEYQYDRYGILNQIDPKPFYYSQSYQQKQSTNSQMVSLRLGWLKAHLNENLSKLNCVEIGSGSGVFVTEAKSNFKGLVPYNLVPPSISKEELFTTNWDICFAFDVIEHMPSLDEIWGIDAKYYYISYPEYHGTPLNEWRHTKVDEHLHHISIDGFRRFVEGKAEIVAEGCPEDIIRTRWDPDLNNITSVLLQRI